MTAAPAPAPGDWPRPATAWYGVGVLLLAYTFAYVDRAILTILVEPIQRDLHINDTQVALLHGFAFVIFYVALGVPLGWAADRTHRVRLIVGSITVWSLMTGACGLAGSFGQLFLARIGVGIGEAGLSPAGYSLISDEFPPERRSTALGVYTLGIYVGSGLAILLGGAVVALVGARAGVTLPLVGRLRSWQLVFMIVGLPGLLVAALASTVREPLRRPEPGATTLDGPGRLRGLGAQLRLRWRPYALIIAGFAFLGTPFNVALLWARPYLSRHFGLAPTHAATAVGLLMLVFATAGILCGSRLSDAWQRRGRVEGPVLVGLIAALALIPFVVGLPFTPTLPLALATLGGLLFFGAFAYGAAAAALALITPNRLRATVSAIYLLCVNLIGLASGPVATGLLTDYVFRDKQALGLAAALVGTVSAAIAATLFAAALRPFSEAATPAFDARSTVERAAG